MVCMGNICRSPMAEGLLRYQLERAALHDKVMVDSAGTHSYHEGSAPDARGQQTAAKRGVSLQGIRSRPISKEDLDIFDYILVMDQSNYQEILLLCETPAQRQRVELLLNYAANSANREVPDPYYGGETGFEQVMDMLEEAVDGLLSHIRKQHRF